MANTPATTQTQNRALNPTYCDKSPDIGSPIAPPKPSVALTRAMPPGRRASGKVVPIMLMASGIAAVAHPCSPRPAMSSAMLLVRAHRTDPAMNRPSATINSRRLPNWSPSLLRTGVAIAAASRVAVTNQETASGDVCNRSGRTGSNGTTIV